MFIPKYKKISDKIYQEIISNTLYTESVIPTEEELCKQFNVSRTTIRNALGLLANQNLLIRTKGKGYIINDTKEDISTTQDTLGLYETKNKDGKITIKIQALPRSSVNKSLEKLLNDVKELSEKYEVAVKINSPYPSWEYRKDSKIREIVVNSFKKITGKDPEIKAIHAGLECGIFDNNMENVDIVSIGPNIYGAHTPEERMEIDSVGKTWELLLKVLEDYNIK